MNNIPIKQTIIASLAFAFSYWKNLLEASIFPLLMALPLISIFPELVNAFQAQFFGIGQAQGYPENAQIYMLMFDYGYISLLINIYRLVVTGTNSISRGGIVLPSLRLGRFFLLFLFLSLITQIPLFIGYPFLSIVVYFLLIPMSLNLVSSANDAPYQRVKLRLTTQFSVFFLKLGIPLLVAAILSFVFSIIGFVGFLFWLAIVAIVYWMAICFALCYRVIMANNSAQSL
ncbi:MAG TPA: hypothetical protein QF725_02195 [Gammaproteobacteria bacterium]|nr:hypothetical protein [Gammaproteobacteria bacterium]